MSRLGSVVLGLVAVCLATGCLYLYLDRSEALRAAEGARRELAEAQAQWAIQREALTKEALKESERARQLEAQWNDKQSEVQRNAQERIRVAQADAARARDAVDVLRRRAEALAAQCSRDQAAPDSGFAAGGQAAPNPGTVLADLLGRLAQTAGELAAVADARGAAGTACEKAYGVLK